MTFLTPFLVASGSVLSVLMMIMIGFFMTKANKINSETASFISWTVLNIALPAYMMRNIIDTFSTTDLKSIPYYISAPVIAILLSYALAWIITTLLKVTGARKSQLIVIMAHTNTIFMGLPINVAMFGDVSIPYVLYYYMANTFIYWTLGVYIIANKTGDKHPFFTLKTFSRIFSPPLLGLFTGLILIAVGIKLPAPINDTLKYIGGLTTPLSMLFIGFVLCNSRISTIRFNRDILYGLGLRFLAGPAVNFAVFACFSMPPLMRSVFLVQSAMPVMANLAIISHEYGSDSEYAAKMCALSTVVSLVVLPFVKIIS